MTVRWTADEWGASFWCQLLGHKYGEKWEEPYFGTEYITTDGIGRQHIALTCECDRCGSVTTVGRIHRQTLEAEMKRVYKKHPHIKELEEHHNKRNGV